MNQNIKQKMKEKKNEKQNISKYRKPYMFNSKKKNLHFCDTL